jgi:uncharacterized protein (TIGR03435 family)
MVIAALRDHQTAESPNVPIRLSGLLICLTLGVVSIHAAQAPLTFEAASVKINNSGDSRRSIGPAPGGRFLATNNTLRALMAFAFGISQDAAGFRIVGGPKWIDDGRFDINAKVEGSWSPQQMSEMLRSLLVDRFKLAAHRETREMPTYALIAASQALGPRLRRSDVDQAACDARRAAIQRREPVPDTPPGAKPVCGTGRTIAGTITAVGWSMDALSSALSPLVDRLVTNRTQLAGLYDFDVTWTSDTPPQLPPDAPRGNIDPNSPSIFTALQEQLGLRLETTRGPVDVIVIDSVERPTPD